MDKSDPIDTLAYLPDITGIVHNLLDGRLQKFYIFLSTIMHVIYKQVSTSDFFCPDTSPGALGSFIRCYR